MIRRDHSFLGGEPCREGPGCLNTFPDFGYTERLDNPKLLWHQRMFDLQGHRGVRALKPENTLPSFETALDLGVTTIETDVLLTRDGVPVLLHDPLPLVRVCAPVAGMDGRTPVSAMTWAPCVVCVPIRPCDRVRFPRQDAAVTPLAQLFAERQGMDPYGVPTVEDLFQFVHAYATDLGARAGKTPMQRRQAARLHLDLELKRVPFRPEVVGDAFDGVHPGLLEERVVAAIHGHGLVDRVTVRSFDHRALRAVRRLDAHLKTAVLLTGTRPLSVVEMIRQAEAQVLCPEYAFVDEALVREAHDHGFAVVPWTVNDPEEAERLLDWGIDGLTTDDPTALFAVLHRRGLHGPWSAISPPTWA